MIPAETMERIRKVVPRLSSDSDGEVLSTVAALKRILSAVGCDFHDLVGEFGAGQVFYVDRIVEKPVFRVDPAEDGEWYDTPRHPIISQGVSLMNCPLHQHEMDFVVETMALARNQTIPFRMSAKQLRWWQRMLTRYIGERMAG
jgi:hypothetical protein